MRKPNDEAPRSMGLPPGFDEESPYEGEDLEEYPEWWRENIQEFREYNLRPYRPPRFEDGEFVPEVIAQIEDEYDVEVQIISTNPSREESWEIRVNENPLISTDKYRHKMGYSVFVVDSDEVRSAVRNEIDPE